jgi:asparagine synthase (glutamine-hydrolysing)
MGMRHSVEGRVPLLDPELVRWAIGVPQHVHVPRWRQKELLRSTVAPFLPRYVLERSKQGFCAPVGSWSEQLLMSERELDEGVLFESGLLDPKALERLRSRGAKAPFGAWTLGVLIEWSRRNLEASPNLEFDLVSS